MLAAQSIVTVEHHADRSWPALESQLLRGWHLRRLQGDDNTRPNSALPPLLEDQERLVDDIQSVEDFYRARGSITNVQVIEGMTDKLAECLSRRRYQYAVPSEVLVADVFETGASHLRPAEVAIMVEHKLRGSWLEAWQQVTGEDAARAHVLRKSLLKVAVPAAYVTLSLDGRPVAVGRGTVAASLLGVFNCATAAEHRGRRLIGRVVEELWHWGLPLGATRSYLQLSSSNDAARNAYQRLGYKLAYEYGYMRSQQT